MVIITFTYITNLMLFMTGLRVSIAQRKIQSGQPTTTWKTFAVYLTRAMESAREYDNWLCGGVLVTEKLILTSAACVTDVEYMYAIAHNHYYVRYEKIVEDPCTSVVKNKVIRSCVPMGYELSYENTEIWSQIDIAIVEVEKPYNIGGLAPTKDNENVCDNKVTIIPLNYDFKYQRPDTEVYMVGWGHLLKWRKPDDNKDYNVASLHYASSLILDKQKCKDLYSKANPKLLPIIDKYMICTNGVGNIDDQGEFIGVPKAVKTECSSQDGRRHEKCVQDVLRKSGNDTYYYPEYNKSFAMETSSDLSHSEKGLPLAKENEMIKLAELFEKNLTDNTEMDNISTILNETIITRKQGICQNDHGGPLLTWRGTELIVIGVASVFAVNKKSECTGPYLFTSTYCNSMFLDCVIHGGKHIKRMGSEFDGYDYVVGNGPDPSYAEDPVYGENEHVHNIRRGSGAFSLDESQMAPPCQRTAAEKGFRFEFRRINWDKFDAASAQWQQKPKIEELTPPDKAGKIKVRQQIPMSIFADWAGASRRKHVGKS